MTHKEFEEIMNRTSGINWQRISIVAIVGVIAGFILGGWVERPKPLDLGYAQNWILIRDYHGIIAPSEGEVVARVSVVSRFSGESAMETIQENKIEIIGGPKPETFMWPDRRDFAAGRCEVLDLDGNGTKEFVLFDGTAEVRVVSYSSGTFQFRRSADRLVSLDFPPGPFDLNSDGRLEFVSDQRFSDNADGKTIQIPHIMRWSDGHGFEDVSSQFPVYYTRQFLPLLRQKLDRESDPQLKNLYSRALEYVENKLARVASMKQ